MTEQMHGPDDLAAERARQERDERRALADGDGTPPPRDEQNGKESGYSTEVEQGAAQPVPDGT